MPAELLEWQESHSQGRVKYALLELIEEHVQEKGSTFTAMSVRLSLLRNYFTRNRVDIPLDAIGNPKPPGNQLEAT